MKRIIPCVAITLALVLAGSYFPVLGLIAPLPLAVLGCAEGRKISGVAELLVEATLFFIISPSVALFFLISCAPLSAAISAVSREDFRQAKKYSGAESLTVCVGVSIVSKLVLLVVFWMLTGRNILVPDISRADSAIVQLYANQPELRGALVSMLALIPHIVPTLLILWCCAETLINYVMCCRITKKLPNTPPALPAFNQWRFSVSLLFAGVLSLLAGYFINADEWFAGSVFIMNVQIVLNAFMFVQGVSMAFWIMDGFKFRRMSKVIACIVLSFPFFWPWLIVIGMSDMALNLRERIKFGGK